MTETPFFVVDTSVALNWHLEDEDQVPEALAVLEDYRRGRISLLAPDNIRYEFAGAIRKAVSRRRISSEDGRLAIDAFLGLELRTVRSNSLIVMAYATAAAYRCSLYDGLYVSWRNSLSRPWSMRTVAFGTHSATVFPSGCGSAITLHRLRSR